MHSCCHSVRFRLSSVFLFLCVCVLLFGVVFLVFLPTNTYTWHFLITDLSLFLLLRYYFKKASDEFECGAVFEEVLEDATVLPMYEGKVLGKVERMD